MVTELENAINEMLPGLTIYARDVNLPPEFAKLYKAGMIIREKGFTDASCRAKGMITSHRYTILSNHMRDFRAFEHGTNWGLFVAQKDSHFKVLDIYECGPKTQITLLHLPDDDRWKLFENVELSVEAQLIQTCRKRFESRCMGEVTPELATPEWLARCQFPICGSDLERFVTENKPLLETSIKVYHANKESDMAVYMVFNSLAEEKVYLPTNSEGHLLSLMLEGKEIIPIFSSKDKVGPNEPVQLKECYLKDYIEFLLKVHKHLFVNPFSQPDIKFFVPYDALEKMLLPLIKKYWS